MIDDGKWGIVEKCAKSLRGHDELVVFAHKENMGFVESWNAAVRMTRGDYIVCVGDNNFQTSGDLKDLCIPDTITSPTHNGVLKEFWAFVFCLPRTVYEKYGLYDMIYNEGIHYMDEDFYRRMQKEQVPMRGIQSVNFEHPLGGRTVNKQDKFTLKVQRNSDIFRSRWS